MAADILFACVAFLNDFVVQVMVQRPPSNVDWHSYIRSKTLYVAHHLASKKVQLLAAQHL